MEFQIFGPPGTGKTTRLATRDIPKAVEKYGPDKIVVTSYTRAAAHEIASKPSAETGETIAVNSSHVGTLHSLCYRKLGQPQLVENHTKEWNDLYPNYAFGSSTKNIDQMDIHSNAIESNGDKLLLDLNLKRVRMIDRKMWSVNLLLFEKYYNSWKEENGYYDLTDLIETAYRDMPYAPGNPAVIFGDEAQDFAPLNLALLRQWGMQAEWLILCGDDDQAIMKFAGADPSKFILNNIRDEHKAVLGQSHRVPRLVHMMAENIITKVRHRAPKTYLPTKNEGELARLRSTIQEPEEFLDYVNRDIDAGMKVMILMPCHYMIKPTISALRSYGIPFHNPFRKEFSPWNPLRTGTDGITTSKDVLTNFVSKGPDENFWTVRQFLKWVPYIKVGDNGIIRKHGNNGIKFLKDAVESEMVAHEDLLTVRNIISDLLSPNAVTQALDRNIDWLIDQIKNEKKEALEYPVKVYKNNGLDALENEPKITIGTIHSVKGGEADSVYLFPELTPSIIQELEKTRYYDDLYRLFYVGATRSKHKLTLMSPKSKQSMGFHKILSGCMSKGTV